jgi:DNA-binding transcriptional regulator YhcF (GntR family)
VADLLREEIVAGVMEVGAQLPTQFELVDRFGVSRDTVQKALKELQRDGYVRPEQGIGVFVLDWRHGNANGNGNGDGNGKGSEAAQTESASVELESVIADAFEADEITIDAFCMTTESLSAAIVRQVRRIERRELSPESIRVRLLLPRTDVQLAIPRNVADAQDPRPRARLQGLIDLHTGALMNGLASLSGRGFVKDVTVEVRVVPLTPVTKLYLINKQQALIGYYRIVENSVELAEDEGLTTIYDVLGVGARLYPHGREQFMEWQEWFESVWTTIAE